MAGKHNELVRKKRILKKMGGFGFHLIYLLLDRRQKIRERKLRPGLLRIQKYNSFQMLKIIQVIFA